MPAKPKTKNGARHPYAIMIATTMVGVSAAPNREPAWVTPCAKPRSVGRIQRESDRVAMGNAPASPRPKKTWIVSIEIALHAAAVRQVNALHQVTTSDRARRAPILSPNHPPGIWNSAYAMRKAKVIH